MKNVGQRPLLCPKENALEKTVWLNCNRIRQQKFKFCEFKNRQKPNELETRAKKGRTDVLSCVQQRGSKWGSWVPWCQAVNIVKNWLALKPLRALALSFSIYSFPLSPSLLLFPHPRFQERNDHLPTPGRAVISRFSSIETKLFRFFFVNQTYKDRGHCIDNKFSKFVCVAIDDCYINDKQFLWYSRLR